ncbi:hypothetical protein M3Y95_00181800 [Aphelenchoides besseyi]|nr:hypothetical protein M3Y95_00181800 [Aphelenchoides besseyi]
MDANLDSNEKRAIFWLFLEAKYKLQVPTKPMKTLMEAFGFDYIWQAYTYFTELEKIQKEHEYNAGPTAAPFLIKLTSSLFTYEQVRMWTDAFYECARDVLITELRDYTKVSYEHYLITETCITVEQYWKSVHGLSVKNAVNSSSSRNVSLGSHWTRNFAEIHHMSIPLKTKLIRVGMSTCAKKLSCYRNESVHRGQTASWFTPANVIEALIESVSELWDAPVAAFKAIVTIVIDNRRIKLNACPQRKGDQNHHSFMFGSAHRFYCSRTDITGGILKAFEIVKEVQAQPTSTHFQSFSLRS